MNHPVRVILARESYPIADKCSFPHDFLLFIGFFCDLTAYDNDVARVKVRSCPGAKAVHRDTRGRRAPKGGCTCHYRLPLTLVISCED
jgi:hypothetical protein